MKNEKVSFIDDISKQIDNKFEELVKNIDSQETQKEIISYLDTASKFHNYSINNQILIGDE
jgi:translation initiation factor RLI1